MVFELAVTIFILVTINIFAVILISTNFCYIHKITQHLIKTCHLIESFLKVELSLMIWKNPASIMRISQLRFIGTQVAARCCYSCSEMVKQYCIWRDDLESTMKILSPLAVTVKILIAPCSETCSQKHWRMGERGSRKRENERDGEKTKRERWGERGKISSN